MVKIKWDNAKYSLSLTRKTDFLCFTFLTSARSILHFFNQKLFICIHLSFFMHIIQNDTILPSFNITEKHYWKSGIFMWMERQTTKAKRILAELLQIIARNCLNKRFSSGQLCRRQIIQKAIFPGGNYLLGNCKEAKIWRQSSRG